MLLIHCSVQYIQIPQTDSVVFTAIHADTFSGFMLCYHFI